MGPDEPDAHGRRADAHAAAAGVLAAGLTVAAAHLVAAVVAPGAGPVLAVGDAFVDLTPAWLKDLAIAWFGTADKVALLVGIGLVLGLLAAGIGVLARRRAVLGVLGVVALGALGAVAAAGRPDAPGLAVVPSLLGAAVGAFSLRALLDRVAPASGAGGAPPAGGPTRRSFLVASGVVTATAVLAAAGGTVIDRARRATVAVRDRLRLPTASRPAPPLPDGVQAPVDGVVPFATPVESFYRIDTALAVPRVDPAAWRLRVHGMVEREVVLDFDELLAADLVEAWVTLACVSNPVGGDLVGNAKWLGLPVREVLGRAGPLAGADMVLSTSADGFTASTPLEALTDDRDALLAVGMDGEPLPLAHGFPVRMVVPGLYGYVSATKWLVDLEVTTFADREAYWTSRGWAERGPVKVSSRVEVPRRGDDLPAGRVVVAGTAWAQHTGISAVQVQVDDEPWQEAVLASEVSADTWRQWWWEWTASPGPHVLRARATRADGLVQTGRVAPPVPDGATGWHEVEVTVRPA